jgi:hypothetical protein
MIRKAKNFSKGVKNTMGLSISKRKPHKSHKTIDSQERVDKCLNCTKPAKECKGDCFGRSN